MLSRAQKHSSAQSTDIDRRQILVGSGAMVAISQLLIPSEAWSGGLLRSEDLIGPEIPQHIADYFVNGVHLIQREIGAGFNARLAIYGVTKSLPSGSPGDPAKDYNKGRCGTFIPPSLQGVEPYQCCSQRDAQDDMLTRECCRHYAYCVPYDRFPARPADSVSTVVLSSRVFNASDETVEGIISHELGHAIDFTYLGRNIDFKIDHVTFVMQIWNCLCMILIWRWTQSIERTCLQICSYSERTKCNSATIPRHYFKALGVFPQIVHLMALSLSSTFATNLFELDEYYDDHLYILRFCNLQPFLTMTHESSNIECEYTRFRDTAKFAPRDCLVTRLQSETVSC